MILVFIILLLMISIFTWINSNKIKAYYILYNRGRSPWFVIYFLLLFGLVLIFLPILFTRLSWAPFDYQNTGEIGDLIGGSTAPFIGFTGILVTFFAFWVQYQANLQQIKANRDQAVDISKERFENQYYEMLRLHKENVQEMNISNLLTARKCFVRMFYEFRYIYLMCYGIATAQSKLLGKEYTKEELCELSYKLFFNGIGLENDDTILILFKQQDHPLIVLVRERLFKVQSAWDEDKNYLAPAVSTEDDTNYIQFEIMFYPFDGHTTRLGHYYRHLFQTVSFVVDSKLEMDRLERYKYLKLLRAQLSDHEQLLLYYNGLTSFGEEWITNNFFDDYRMIKNIPFLYANFGIKPLEKLGTMNRFHEHIFEWQSRVDA